MVRVNISDVMAAGFCVRGIRDWFRKNSLNFKHFMKHGEDADVLLATGDPLAERAVEKARQRHG